MPLAEATHPPKEAVIAKALLSAAGRLGVSAKELSRVVGVSETALSRLKSDPRLAGRLSDKSCELALLFIRLYRSLDVILGGDDAAARRWMRAANAAFGSAPLDRIRTIDGLAHVLAYLDDRRAPL